MAALTLAVVILAARVTWSHRQIAELHKQLTDLGATPGHPEIPLAPTTTTTTTMATAVPAPAPRPGGGARVAPTTAKPAATKAPSTTAASPPSTAAPAPTTTSTASTTAPPRPPSTLLPCVGQTCIGGNP